MEMITVQDLFEDLSGYNPDLKIRFHTKNRRDLNILSIYIGDDENILEVDIGDDTDV